MKFRYRRPGSRWRLLVHDMAPNGTSSVSRHYQSHPDKPREPSHDPELDARLAAVHDKYTHTEIVANSEFDELVVGQALHIEQMDTGTYWMNIGGVTVWLRMDRDGRATSVDVYGPGDYDSPWDGVTYGGAVASEDAR